MNFKEIAQNLLDCEFVDIQRISFENFTAEHRFTPNTGACVYACTIYYNDEIGYCSTYDNDEQSFIECIIDALKQVL
jgi:hypothetical protein